MIRLNVKQDHAHIIPLGDLHIGHKNCNIVKIKEIIDYIKSKEDCWVIGMGDYMDLGLVKDSPGKSNYEQNLTSQDAFNQTVKLLSPIKEKLLALLPGHHEERVTKKTGIDVTNLLAKVLNVPYYGWVLYDKIYVNGEKYSLVATHGNTSARTLNGKIKACMDLQHIYNSDIYIYGHTHELAAFSTMIFDYDEGPILKKKWFVLTGHFLDYWGSYAQEREMKPGKMGVAKIELFANKHDIHVKV